MDEGVTVGDVLVAMEDLGGYLRDAIHDRQPEVDLVPLAVAVLRRLLTENEKALFVTLRGGGAIGIKLGCGR